VNRRRVYLRLFLGFGVIALLSYAIWLQHGVRPVHYALFFLTELLDVILWYVFVAYFLAGELGQLLKAEIDDDGFELV